MAMKIIFIALTVFTLVIFPFVTNGQLNSAPTTTSTAQSIIIEDSEENKNVEYILGLEQTVRLLQTTNESLTQRWTPINSILTALSVLFAIITILWGIIFAFGLIAYGAIKKHQKALANEAQSLNKSGKEALSIIEQEGKKLLIQLKDNTNTLQDKEKKLGEFQQRAEKTIDEFRSKTFTAISESTYPFATGVSSILSGGGNVASLNNAKICSNCGAIFMPKSKKFDLNSTLNENWGGDFLRINFTNNVLCQRCLGPSGENSTFD